MQTIQLSLSPEQAADDNAIRTEIAKTLSVDTNDISSFRIVRKSIDARGRRPVVILQLNVFVGEQPDRYAYFNTFDYHNVTNAKEVIVVGSGPAGLFAALRLIELGLRPIIVERKNRRTPHRRRRPYLSQRRARRRVEHLLRRRRSRYFLRR